MIFDLPDPVTYVVKAILSGAVVGQNDALSSSVVGLGDGPKPFLACGIPDLNLDCLSVEVDLPDFEVNACTEKNKLAYIVRVFEAEFLFSVLPQTPLRRHLTQAGKSTYQWL